jgi:hypothetical protein
LWDRFGDGKIDSARSYPRGVWSPIRIVFGRISYLRRRDAKKAVKRLSGYFYDGKHVATYAPYCDAFVVDQAMAELLAKPTAMI